MTEETIDKCSEYQMQLTVVTTLYADVVWTHKIHEKQAEIYINRNAILQRADILSSSITCASVGTLLLGWLAEYQTAVNVITALSSFATTALTLFLKCFDYARLAAQHKSFATRFLGVRNRLRQIICELKSQSRPLKEIRSDLATLNNELQHLYELAPQTTETAVNKAKEALNIKKEASYSSEEINNLMPDNLRQES